MKTLLITLVALASGLGAGYSIQDNKQDKKATDAAMQMPKPGPQHALLQKGIGTWDAAVTAKDDKGVEQKSKGSMITTKHGDFFTIDNFEGEMMGQKFVGHGVNGYCPIKKQYFCFWTDSCLPTPMMLTGDYDETKHELTMTGDCVDMSGKVGKCRTVTRTKDDNHFSFAMYGPGPDGKETTMVSIDYTRKK